MTCTRQPLYVIFYFPQLVVECKDVPTAVGVSRLTGPLVCASIPVSRKVCRFCGSDVILHDHDVILWEESKMKMLETKLSLE